MDELRWRIPTGGDPSRLRFGLAQIGLATVVAALLLFAVAPRAWLGWSLAGLIPLAVFMAYRKWRAYHSSLAGPDNVRLDGAGLHWLDAAGNEQTIFRAGVLGFRLAREDDTLRPVTALTFYIEGGFESQPLELHPPATAEAVRSLLKQNWQIAERAAQSGRESLDYERAIDVYSECHDDFQEWHWEGTREQLIELFAALRTAAVELPLPPVGAKPAQRVILARRREPLRLRIAHTSVPRFDFDLLSGPAETLRQIAAAADELLSGALTPSDHKFDVRLAANNAWTFHLHVREA